MTDQQPHDLLPRSGEALYGDRWQTQLAKDLGISDRTVRRWVATGVVPDAVWADLDQLLAARQRAIHDLRTSLAAV